MAQTPSELRSHSAGDQGRPLVDRGMGLRRHRQREKGTIRMIAQTLSRPDVRETVICTVAFSVLASVMSMLILWWAA